MLLRNSPRWREGFWYSGLRAGLGRAPCALVGGPVPTQWRGALPDQDRRQEWCRSGCSGWCSARPSMTASTSPPSCRARPRLRSASASPARIPARRSRTGRSGWHSSSALNRRRCEGGGEPVVQQIAEHAIISNVQHVTSARPPRRASSRSYHHRHHQQYQQHNNADQHRHLNALHSRPHHISLPPSSGFSQRGLNRKRSNRARSARRRRGASLRRTGPPPGQWYSILIA